MAKEMMVNFVQPDSRMGRVKSILKSINDNIFVSKLLKRPKLGAKIVTNLVSSVKTLEIFILDLD